MLEVHTKAGDLVSVLSLSRRTNELYQRAPARASSAVSVLSLSRRTNELMATTDEDGAFSGFSALSEPKDE